MGKRIPQRRRGKGSNSYKASSHRFKAMTTYKTYTDEEKNNVSKGKIIELIHDPARSAPLMIVQFNEQTVAMPAPLGVMKGQVIEGGINAQLIDGNYLPLKNIPEGTVISNIELVPGDGGKLARGAGAKARVVSKDKNKVIVRLASKQFKTLNENCRAMLGTISGAGHRMKPLLKAGANYFKRKAKGLPWPVVSGCKRQAREHPHGGKQHRMRKSKTVSRNSPPGAKVGSFASKRTGRGGGKKRG